MLLKRVVSGLIAVAAILVVLFVLPEGAIAPVLLVVVAASAWEWSSLARLKATPSRLLYTLLIVGLTALYWRFTTPQLFGGLLSTAGFWWIAALFLVLRYPVRIPSFVVKVGGPLTLVSMFAALDGLARFGDREQLLGPVLLLYVLVVIWAADIGGYFAGRAIGGAKLAVNVSPNKTWAGVLGGLALSALVGLVGEWMFDIGWYRIVALCAVTAAVSVLGDLTISLFKREAGLKDSGTLFPGHGGLLDRVDSISAGSVLFAGGLILGHGPW
ncbi:MAG: phosphatidate cytidylyltransferase [Pseudomonadota bacterium]